MLQHFLYKNRAEVEISSKMKLPQLTILKGDSIPCLYKDYTQELIGFKDVTVTFVERKERKLFAYSHDDEPKITQVSTSCGKDTNKIHDYRTQRIKDISSFGPLHFDSSEKA